MLIAIESASQVLPGWKIIVIGGLENFMDLMTIIGLVAALGLMLMAMGTGGSIFIFVNVPSLIIVVGGTIGTTLVHYPLREVKKTISVLKKGFKNYPANPTGRIDQLVEFAGRARKEGILSLQSVMGEVKDPFFIKGIQMAVDGFEPESLKEMLEREIEYLEERHGKGSEMLTAMGAYAPAMGMVGTLIGLVQMLQTLEDPSTIGPAMAVALLTTFYGAVMANVIFIPMAGKLKIHSQSEVLDKSLVVEGLRLILEGENPRIIESKLHAYVPPKSRKSSFS
jgi:chemotaxis protein MotA